MLQTGCDTRVRPGAEAYSGASAEEHACSAAEGAERTSTAGNPTTTVRAGRPPRMDVQNSLETPGGSMKGRGEPKKQQQSKKATKSIKEKRREKKEKKANR